MDKLDLKSKEIVDNNIEKIGNLFPNTIVESEKGKTIDFDLLRQELSDILVEGNKEKYQLTWPGKKDSILKANTPTNKTLRPCKEESVDFDKTENLYIEGDNLEVLKILQESYLNKIKVIYIDPPYNTGNDFIYKDDFKKTTEEELLESGQTDEEGNRLVSNNQSNGRYHSDWLSMMYSRLKLARNLLTEDGVIFISIDDNEQSNLKKMCDELFGENNFIATLIRKVMEGGKSDSKGVAVEHEYCHIYYKNNINGIYKKKSEKTEHYNKKDEYFEDRGYYYLKPLENGGLGYVKSLDYPIIGPDNVEIYPGGMFGDNGYRWVWSKQKLDKAINMDMIKFVKSQSDDSKFKVYYKIYEKIDTDGEKCIRELPFPSLYLDGFTNRQAINDVKKVFDNNRVFDYPKPVSFIKEVLAMTSKNDDIILDFFAGSSTTAQATMQLNAEDGGKRRYIMVQLPENIDDKSEAYKAGYKNICELGKDRIRRSGANIKEETGSDIDYGFRVYKLDSSNMKDVYYNPNKLGQAQLDLFESNIKEDRTSEDLLAQIILDLGLELSLKIEEKEILGNKVYFVEDNYLVACFDEKIDMKVIDEIAKDNPLILVFKDASFDDNSKINISERMKRLSPETKIKII